MFDQAISRATASRLSTGVIEAVDFELLAEGGAKGINGFGQRGAQHANAALVVHVAVVKQAALVNQPVVRLETAGGVAEQLHVLGRPNLHPLRQNRAERAIARRHPRRFRGAQLAH